MSAGDRIRVCVVGGGLAGSLLAWRLACEPDIERVDVALGAAFRMLGDATSASAGVVRGFDPDPEVSRLAVDSLVELYGDQRLRRWSGYREVGSLYIRDTALTPVAQLASLVQQLPGSARLLSASELRSRGWTDLPSHATALIETRAGRLSPSALRGELLRALSRVSCVKLMRASLARLTLCDARSVRCDFVGGPSQEYDVAVLSAGRWTGALLRGSGRDEGHLRVKAIQCGIWQTAGRRHS